MDLHKVNNKLGDLKTSNPFFPPDANAPRALKVVPIHNNVNQEVEGNGNPGHGSEANELSVAQEGSSTMMVAV